MKPDGSDAGAEAAATTPEKLVFVTSETKQGFFGGQAAADDYCRQRSPRPTVAWRAWISDDNSNAIDRVGNGPWYRSDHQQVFANKAALASPPKVPLNIDELGNTVSADQLVWTGTDASGQTAQHCGFNWGTSLGKGAVGQVGALDKTWTEFKDASCTTAAHFYCFEL
ncbi:MAG: hypothetical protein KF764_05740 [Labilithrix sp.]|nr:hypothetical protein [Labilithrix sp.]